MTAEGKLVTDTAKSSFMVWNIDSGKFEMKANVIRPAMRWHPSGVVILTNEGLAHYSRDAVLAATGDPLKPAATIALGDTSHCLQAIAEAALHCFATVTGRGMIQRVAVGKDGRSLELLHAAQMDEGVTADVVFSAIAYGLLAVIAVAGFDVDRHANMLILVSENGVRMSKTDTIERDDGLPIVGVEWSWSGRSIIRFLISWSTRSVYVHYHIRKSQRLNQVFDRYQHEIVINGVIGRYDGNSNEDYIILIIYSQLQTRGKLVRLKQIGRASCRERVLMPV